MNAIFRISILSILLIIISYTEAHCQQFTWEWAKKVSETKNTPYLQIKTIDTQNNALFLSSYSDTIIFPDTIFSHPDHSYSKNYAFSRYNTNGKFLEAADIFTWPGNDLDIDNIFSDKHNNIIVAGEFMERVFFQDTFLVHTGGPYTYNDEVFVLKYSPDYEIIWSGVIGSDYSDDLDDYAVSDGITCLAIHNYTSDQNDDYLYIFEDDSMLIERECVSIITIDSSRSILWINKIAGADTYTLYYGDDNILYYCGNTNDVLLINNDTLLNLDPQNPSKDFIIAFEENGELKNFISFDYNLRFLNIETSKTGEHYISGMIRDSLILNDDTIAVPEDHNYQILIKHNPEMIPEWYKIIDHQNDLYGVNMDIELSDSNLIFKITGNRFVTFEDTAFNFSFKSETIFGDYSLEGQLENILTTESSYRTFFGDFILDNCQNIIGCGSLWGYSIFGNDTLYQNSTYNDEYQGFYAKINRNPTSKLELGNDTVVCEEYTLFAPEGFTWYVWNDSVTTSNTHYVDSSCVVKLECGNDDGCWLEDEIFIEVRSSSNVISISDTILALSDSLVIDIGNNYESINWFNGTHMETITIHGSDYVEGTYLFWVETFDGICALHDTIVIDFVNTDFIDESYPVEITIYPVPIKSICFIKSNKNIERIEFYNQYGRKIHEIDQTQITNNNAEFIMHDLNSGVYFAIITINKKRYLRKIIKL